MFGLQQDAKKNKPKPATVTSTIPSTPPTFPAKSPLKFTKPSVALAAAAARSNSVGSSVSGSSVSNSGGGETVANSFAAFSAAVKPKTARKPANLAFAASRGISAKEKAAAAAVAAAAKNRAVTFNDGSGSDSGSVGGGEKEERGGMDSILVAIKTGSAFFHTQKP